MLFRSPNRYSFLCQTGGPKYSVGQVTGNWWAWAGGVWAPSAFLAGGKADGATPGLPVCGSAPVPTTRPTPTPTRKPPPTTTPPKTSTPPTRKPTTSHAPPPPTKPTKTEKSTPEPSSGDHH